MNGGKLVIGTELDTKSFDAQIEATRKKLEMLEKSADETNIPEKFRRSAEETRQLNVEIEKTRNQLLSLEQQQAKANKTNDVGFKNALSSLKKFALGLIGIRGLYSLASRASSAWLSQDTELAQKFQNIWLGLGAVLQPVLEGLANILLKLLGYVNEFVKAFTGGRVDLIANANAIAIKKQANAMKELKNQTYGFDELNIQQVNNSSSSGSTTSGMIPSIELDPGLVNTVTTIGNVLGNIYGYLKDIIDWCKKHLGTSGTIMLGIGVILGIKALPSAGGTGLLAIYAVALAIYDLFKLIGLVKDWKDTKEAADNVSKSLDVTRDSAKGAKDRILEMFDGKTYEEKRKGIKNLLDITRTNIKDVEKTTTDWEKATDFSVKGIVNSLDGVGDDYKKLRDNAVISASGQIDALIELANQGELTDDEYKQVTELITQYFDTMEDHNNKTMGLLKSDVDDAKNKFQSLNGLKAKMEIEVTTNDKTKTITQKINTQIANTAGGMISGGNPLTIAFQLINATTKAVKQVYGATGGVLNKCAVSSIINNPGRGVYLGNNTIGGESGPEGLIPLTDPNAMTELGETIARYIPINITNVTKLDSKILNKETKTISNDMDFIRNGGVA